MKDCKYALITPARNEEKCIESTLNSVVSQTILPKRWIIVSDGSVDRTDEIVDRYREKYNFIKLLRTNRNGDQNFSAKVDAFNAGYAQLDGVEYEFIGNLDADVSFEQSYIEQLMVKFHENYNLGIAGGIILEKINNIFVKQNMSLNSVAGAVQLFRRQCFEETEGYTPMRYGGIDAAIEILARMKGWEVRTFPHLCVKHHGRVTTGNRNILKSKFQQGVTNYALGYHPIFQFMSSAARILDSPILAGSFAMLYGYLFAAFNNHSIVMPPDAVNYIRGEQKQRIKSAIFRQRRG